MVDAIVVDGVVDGAAAEVASAVAKKLSRPARATIGRVFLGRANDPRRPRSESAAARHIL